MELQDQCRSFSGYLTNKLEHIPREALRLLSPSLRPIWGMLLLIAGTSVCFSACSSDDDDSTEVGDDDSGDDDDQSSTGDDDQSRSGDDDDQSSTDDDDQSPSGDDDDQSSTGDDDSGDDDQTSTGDDDQSSSGDDDHTSSGDDDQSSSGDDDDNTMSSGDDDATSDSTSSIYYINQYPPANDTAVTTEGVVTAINFHNNFWIQDPKSGQYSGIYIYAENAFNEDAVLPFSVGDKVKITGYFRDYYDLREIALVAAGGVSVTQLGVGVPAAQRLSVDQLLSDACNNGIGERANPYLGVLLSLETSTVGSTTGACSTDSKYGYWKLENLDGSVMVDDDISREYVPQVGDTVGVDGILYYSFAQYKVEATAVTVLSHSDEETKSIFELNLEQVVAGTVVETEGIVTAFSTYDDFWIQDVSGGAYSGIFVYDRDSLAILSGLIAGDHIRILGTYDVYYGLREIKLDAQGSVEYIDHSGVPASYDIDADVDEYSCLDQQGFDAFAGVIVTWPPLTTDIQEQCDNYDDTWEATDDDGNRLIVDNEIAYSYSGNDGAVVELTGILKYTGSAEHFRLNPLGDGGIVEYFLKNGDFENTSDFSYWYTTGEAGIETSYPHEGDRDGYVHTYLGYANLYQPVSNLSPGAAYTLTAWCASDVDDASIAVTTNSHDTLDTMTISRGTGYGFYTLDFIAPADGLARVEYAASRSSSWAVIDDVIMTELRE